jgi:SWI/SNF-related matrix-associated actin-dependent regulator 1 of chromatin subfamily A
MTVTHDGEKFIAISQYEDRFVLAKAGFTWTPPIKKWVTYDPITAERLRQFCDAKAANRLSAAAQTVLQSSSADADIYVPCNPGLSFRGYQKAAIAYALERKNTLLADPVGTGKSWEALGFCNVLLETQYPLKILIVTTASMKITWMRECQRVLTKNLPICVVNGSDWFPGCCIYIINYDLLKRHHDNIRDEQWDVVIGDEIQKCCNPSSLRSKELFGCKEFSPLPAGRVLALSATPMRNRPKDLFPIVSYLDPLTWGTKSFPFYQRYCGAKQVRIGYNKYAWDFSGSSNLGELSTKLRASCMIRREKQDILSDLPERLPAQIVEFKPTKSAQATIDEMYSVVGIRNGRPQDFVERVNRMKVGQLPGFTEFSRLRKQLGVDKISVAVDHIGDCLENGKVVAFAHHVEVVQGIAAAFGDRAVFITGDTPQKKRQAVVDCFQNDPECELFVGQIQACGEGLTLTAGNQAILVEFSWVPSENEQAIGRVDRIGQRSVVTPQYLVWQGSLDVHVAQTFLGKDEVISAVMGG